MQIAAEINTTEPVIIIIADMEFFSALIWLTAEINDNPPKMILIQTITFPIRIASPIPASVLSPTPYSTERRNSSSSNVVDQLVAKRTTVLSGPHFSQKLNDTCVFSASACVSSRMTNCWLVGDSR